MVGMVIHMLTPCYWCPTPRTGEHGHPLAALLLTVDVVAGATCAENVMYALVFSHKYDISVYEISHGLLWQTKPVIPTIYQTKKYFLYFLDIKS